MMSIHHPIVMCLLVILFIADAKMPAQGNELSAEAILKKADAYRNFKDTAFSFDLTLTSKEKDKKAKVFGMHAKIYDSHTSVVAYKTPKREQGKALLMNGRNLWFFSKLAKKPIRITPQQRLLGEASNGDVASTDFSGDYIPYLIDGEDTQDQAHYRLRLEAIPDSLAAYHQVQLWLEKTTFKPLKAEFYSTSGKHLKTAHYTKYTALQDFDGKLQLTELEIHSAIKDGSVTKMEYSGFQLEDLEENQFRPTQVRRIIADI